MSLGESFSTGIIWNQSVGFWGPNAYHQLMHPQRKPNVFSTIPQMSPDISVYEYYFGNEASVQKSKVRTIALENPSSQLCMKRYKTQQLRSWEIIHPKCENNPKCSSNFISFRSTLCQFLTHQNVITWLQMIDYPPGN